MYTLGDTMTTEEEKHRKKLASQKRYREANKEKIQEAKRLYIKANNEKIKERRRKGHPPAWHSLSDLDKNAKRANCSVCGPVKVHVRKNGTSQCITKTRDSSRRGRARKRDAYCGCVPIEATLFLKELYGDKCFYCGGEFEHVDHFIPLARGGFDCVDNIVPSCATCNTSKNDFLPEDWAKWNGDFPKKSCLSPRIMDSPVPERKIRRGQKTNPLLQREDWEDIKEDLLRNLSCKKTASKYQVPLRQVERASVGLIKYESLSQRSDWNSLKEDILSDIDLNLMCIKYDLSIRQLEMARRLAKGHRREEILNRRRSGESLDSLCREFEVSQSFLSNLFYRHALPGKDEKPGRPSVLRRHPQLNQIEADRESGMTYKELEARYGVGRGSLSRYFCGK